MRKTALMREKPKRQKRLSTQMGNRPVIVAVHTGRTKSGKITIQGTDFESAFYLNTNTAAEFYQ